MFTLSKQDNNYDKTLFASSFKGSIFANIPF